MKPLSADRKGDTVHFVVWAPEKDRMLLHLVHPREDLLVMTKGEQGYFELQVPDLTGEVRYFFRPDGEKDYPDPASRHQPEGVHGPSQLVDHAAFDWTDGTWKGLPFKDLICYELHVGTFTPAGTFEAIVPRLDELKAVGVNALQLMPVTQFPGGRNWGYDGAYPYAVQNTYGGPNGLKILVDACHSKGFAVFLDVVYNHLGPEGNFFREFGPYFTDTYKTPWGDALNFDGAWSDGVRDFFSGNALHWFRDYHIDGLRCDAIHAVYDNGAVHFWELLHHRVKELEQQLGRALHMVAESDLNSPKVVTHPEAGGFGFDAVWLDDFHHALYTVTDPQGKERYYDFGQPEQLAKAYKEGFVHSGQWVKFRKRLHGRSSASTPGSKFVVFNLNHDQVGNRVDGKRLSVLVDFERVKMAAAAILLAPYIPMLFMGEEYGDETPFYYFVSHSDPALIKAVQEGRREEFKDFGFDRPPPDPQAEATFRESSIHWEKRRQGHHRVLRHWHTELIRLRRSLAPFMNFDKGDIDVTLLRQQGFALIRYAQGRTECAVCLFNFSDEWAPACLPAGVGPGQKILDSKDGTWAKHPGEEHGSLPRTVAEGDAVSLPPLSVVVYHFAGPRSVR